MRETVAIIGGGAAGLAAAVSCAANSGNRVVILEKNQRLGKKILATGNGRCNFTNTNMDLYFYTSSDPERVGGIIHRYGPDEIIRFFHEAGLLHRVEEEGRVYPYSGQASSVLDCLRLRAAKLGVEEITPVDVSRVAAGKRFTITDTKGAVFTADKVIVACGGPAGVAKGTGTRGIQLLESLGHKKVNPYPALVQLRTVETLPAAVAGVRIKCAVKASVDGEMLEETYGEVQFTSYGLSGIPIFQFSGLERKEGLTIALDLFPHMTQEALFGYLESRIGMLPPACTMEDFLTGTINKKLGHAILKLSGIHKLSMTASLLVKEQIAAIAAVLKHLEFHISGTNGFENAQVTGGGILLRQFHAETLESLLCPGVYAAGEVLDVYGKCGGYNLHWAWASGIAAGRGASGFSGEYNEIHDSN